MVPGVPCTPPLDVLEFPTMTPNTDTIAPVNPPYTCKRHGHAPQYRWRGAFRCLLCKREAAQRYRLSHPDVMKAATDKYRAKYPDRVRASGRASYARNKDRWLAKRREERRLKWDTGITASTDQARESSPE